MLGWLGSAITGATKLGGQWLSNRGRVANAEAELKLADLGARVETAKQRADLELEQLRQTSSLDQMAMRQAAKSWFDEVLAVLVLSPVAFIIYGTMRYAPPEFWAASILGALQNLPTWYLVAVGLVLVNYFSFRSLLRVGLKAWGNKIGLNFEAKDGAGNPPKPNSQPRP